MYQLYSQQKLQNKLQTITSQQTAGKTQMKQRKKKLSSLKMK